jgi:hypothetical protein
MTTVAICVYCSQKIEEKEKSVNVPHLPGGVAPPGVRPEGNDPNRPSKVTGPLRAKRREPCQPTSTSARIARRTSM